MISIIIPFFNEAENLPILLESLEKELNSLNQHSTHPKELYEILLIDDGSLDEYETSISTYISQKNIHLLKHNRQMGKGKALTTGLSKAKGDRIVFMDADLQDDPKDIQILLQKLEEGYDLVNGVRVDRKDNLIIRLYSKTAQWVLQTFLHSPFTDINCGFKTFRKEIASSVHIYGNNFRFFPLAVYFAGFTVSEVEVHNRPRLHGKSKFGMRKLFIGLIDMLTAYFLYRFSENPLHFFGIIGGVIFFPGMLIVGWLGFARIFFGELLYRRPILHLGILMVVVGLQIIMTGIIGELIVYSNRRATN